MIFKERVKLAIEFKKTDRVPVKIYMTPEIQEKLTKHFSGRDLLEVFEIDFRDVYAVWKGKFKKHETLT